MADEIKLKAPKVEQTVNIVVNGKEDIKDVANTLNRLASGSDILKYLKNQEQLVDKVTDAYQNFNKTVSKNNAAELVKTINALKAVNNISSDVDLGKMFPDLSKIIPQLSRAQSLAGDLIENFSVNNFSSIVKSLGILEQYGLNMESVFSKLTAKGNFDELTRELDNQTRKIDRYKNKIYELEQALEDAENASGVDDLKRKLRDITANAKETFEAFLKVNNIDRIDEEGYYASSKFSKYFDAIENGSMSAQEAIAKFKAEYGYLLEDSFKNSNNSFGLEQLKIFQDTLDQVLTTVEDFHRKLDTLPDDMKNIQSSGKSDQVLFDEEQLKSVLSVFSEIKDSLSSLRSVVSDVGDGEELSPLLQMIKNVEIAVSSLNTAMSKIKLNINIESQGTDEQLLAKIEERKQTLLAAYRDQFNAMRQVKPSGMTVVGSMKRAKESSATISALNKSVNAFSEDDFDNIDQKIAAYVNIIQKLKRLSELSYGENIYENMDKSFQNKVSSAKGMLTKANNTIGSNVPEGLEGLFGGKTDLSEVIEQLKLIVTELGKVSKAAVDIKTSLGDGIQLNDSLQQIESLTQKVQNLEAKLTSLKSSTSLPSTETNISSESSSMEQAQKSTDQAVQAKEDFAKANAGVQASVNESKSPLQLEAELMDKIAESARKAADAKKEFVEANGKVAASAKDSVPEINAEKDVFEEILPSNFKGVLDGLNLTKSELGEIVKITKQAHADAKGKFSESYILKDKYGSTETYGKNSKTDKSQLLSYNYVEYDANAVTKEKKQQLELEKQLASEIEKQTAAQQKQWEIFLQKEENYKKSINDVNTAISKTDDLLAELPVPTELELTYSKLIDDVDILNEKLKNHEIEKPEYNKQVKGLLSDYSTKNNIQQKRDIEGYKKYDADRDEAYKVNDTLNKVDALPKYEELSSELDNVKNKIKSYNEQLMAGTLSIESYDQFVKELITDYKELAKIKDQIDKIELNDKASAEKKLEQEKETALKWTKSQSQRLSDAISKYSYGDTTDAKAMMQQMNNGLLNFGDFSNIQGNILNLQKTIDQIISSLKKAHDENLAAINAEVKAEESETKIAWNEKLKAIREYISAVERLNELIAQDKGTGKNASAIEKQQEKVERLKNNAFEAKDAMEKLVDSKAAPADSLAQWVNTVERLEQASKDASSAMQEAQKSIQAALTSEYKSMNDGLADYEAKMRSFNSRKPEDRRSDYSTALKGYTDALERYRNELQKIQNHPELINETEINNLKNMRQELDKAATSLKGIDKGSTAISRDKMINKISDYMKKNSAMSKEFKSELEGLIQKLKTLGAEADTTRIADEFFKITQRIREAGQEGKKFWDVVKEKAWYGLAGTIGTYFGFNDLIQYGRQAAQTIINLDTALVDLKKTTTMSSSQLKEFYFDANNVAKQMGVSTQQIIEQASAWSRLGYNTQQTATEMAKLSSKFASISPGMDTTQAQEGLVSIMKAFDVDTNDVESKIMDKINTLGNKFAESNLDIVEGLKRSSAAMAAMGQSFEDTAALFTGGMEILQDSESMGTALRSVAMRIRGYSEETGELDGELQNVNGDVLALTKTAKDAQGVSIFTDATQQHYKSMVQYLGEIADRWDDISEQNQTELLNKLFAKTRAQAGAAILKNFDQVRKALTEMEQSAGSADREMETVESSLEYKLNSLKQTWVGTAQAIIDRGDLGIVIDGITKVSEVLGTLIDKIGLVKGAAIALGAALSFNNVGRDKMYSLTCF